MTTSPYAKALYQVSGGASTFGGSIVAGGSTIQLLGENTNQWNSVLWEIYDYPPGFPAPTGWNTVNNVYQTTSVVPPLITLSAAATRWGKYMFRLTVNNALINGVFHGVNDPQPLIYEASAVHVLSPNLSLRDIAYHETNQFDPNRQWLGELKSTLRQLDTVITGAGTLGAISGVSTINGNILNTSNVKAPYQEIHLNTTTPNATLATIWSYATASGLDYVLNGVIWLRNTTNGYAKYTIDSLYTNIGGTLTKTTTTPNDVVTGPESSVSTNVVLTTSGTNIIIQGAGFSASNTWGGFIQLHTISP